MSFSASLVRGSALLLMALWLSGCLPSAQSRSDEEREPYFLSGKSRVSAMDYKGAIESFSKALEVNPRSGLAHFELAWLYDQKESDPAAAIHHYRQYLRFHPGADNAEMVRTRIMACKQELARTVSLGPVTQTMQREFERLTEQNQKLAEENKALREELEKARALTAVRGEPGGAPAAPVRGPDPAPRAAPPAARPAPDPSSVRAASPVAPPARRTHTVKAGETATVIARRYGVKLEALLAANPRVDPRRMQIGQSLVIP